jgi:microcystin-dependent protein
MEGYLASIMLFAADFEPKNWAICNGQIISISENEALFSLLGTTYGGDGVQTFALPDFRGRTAVGPSPSTVLGKMDGANTETLNISNLASHTHPITATLTATILSWNQPILPTLQRLKPSLPRPGGMALTTPGSRPSTK